MIKRFIQNVSYNFSRQLLNNFLSLGTTLLLAHLLEPKGVGEYTILTTFPNFLVSLLSFGIFPATTYLISGSHFPVNYIVRYSLLITLGISFPTTLLGWLLVKLYGEQLFPGFAEKIILLSVFTCPIYLLFFQITAIFVGLQNFYKYNLLSLLPIIFNLFCILIFISILQVNTITAVFCRAFSYAISCVIGIWMLRTYIFGDSQDIDLFNSRNSNFIKALFQYGCKLHANDIINILNYRLDIFLINFFLTPNAVGIYTIAVSFGERIWLISSSFTKVLFPLISSLKDQEYQKNKLTSALARLILLINILIVVILAPFLSKIITILVGIIFLDATQPLLFLLPGIVLWSYATVLACDLSGRGKPEINLYISGVGLFVNIIFNIILIPKLGIIGAAIATSISYSSVGFFTLVMYSKLTRVNIGQLLFFSKDDVLFFYRQFQLFKQSNRLNKK